MRHHDDHLATPSEAVAEWARNIGDQFPDRAWLLHDWDVWVANPHYSGPRVPHPEDAMGDCDIVVLPRAERVFPPVFNEDIPF